MDGVMFLTNSKSNEWQSKGGPYKQFIVISALA